MNITGALDLSTMKIITSEFETINGENIVKFLGQVKEAYPKSKKIHLILDQAGYHKSDNVRAFAIKNGIKLHYLPAYSPNLNPIERLWKVMNETARNNVVFTTAEEFRARIRKFCAVDYPAMSLSLVDRITDNFASGSKSIFILKEYISFSTGENYSFSYSLPENPGNLLLLDEQLHERY